jgi:dienelactone hydrolase
MIAQVLVVMGAFACKDHFGSTARHLADNGYEVRHQLQHEQQPKDHPSQQLPVAGDYTRVCASNLVEQQSQQVAVLLSVQNQDT